MASVILMTDFSFARQAKSQHGYYCKLFRLSNNLLKTRLELALKIQIYHSFSTSCSNNLHQTNKRLRYQSQIYKKSQNTPKTIQNYHKKSTSILKTSQINYCKLYHKHTNHVRYWLCLIYMDYQDLICFTFFGKNYMDNTPILRMSSELNKLTVFFQQ